jgi:hypothetical protein
VNPALTAKIDQRLALMSEALQAMQLEGLPLVMVTLTEFAEDATPQQIEEWERTCDSCGKHCPWPIDFYIGHITRDVGLLQVIITYGVCADCKED